MLPDWLTEVARITGTRAEDWAQTRGGWCRDLEPDGPEWTVGTLDGEPAYISAAWGSALIEVNIDGSPAETVRRVQAAFAALRGEVSDVG